MASLAREIIQNSLDARVDPGREVEVSFEISELPVPAEFRREELKGHVDACLREAEQGEDEEAARFFEHAVELLQKPKMRFLRVSDINTTGLRPDQWMALVKGRGMSVKASPSAAGSFGIGKSAPFAVSGLRTVLYWTAYEENGALSERFQGVSILMSHDAVIKDEEEETQGTGFLGRIDGCLELADSECPEKFRYLDRHGGPIRGTSLWIAEMHADDDWQRNLASSIIANYFHAIQNDMLKADLEPSENGDLWEINRESLADWFNRFDADSDGVAERVKQARPYWELTIEKNGLPIEERIWEDEVLGRCRLRVRVGEGLPRRVGLIRASGMLITTAQQSLQRFPGTRDFVAVCVFESQEANEFLRRMENPKHDQFEPDRLLDKEMREKGWHALGRFCGWVREQIKEIAGQRSEEISDELGELAEYLPDEETAGPFAENPEKGFGGPIRLRTRRPKLWRLISGLEADESGEDGDGDDMGTTGGSSGGGDGGGGPGPSDGSGEGDGKGGSGSRGGGTGRHSVPVQDVRVLAVPGRNCHRLSFTPGHGATGSVRIELQEAGDSTAEYRKDLFVADPKTGSKTALSDYEFQVKAGRRVSIDFVGDDTLSDRAWRLSVISQIER